MPTFHGIVVRLCNDQAEAIEEFCPPKPSLDLPSKQSKQIPLHDESTSTVNIFVPVIPRTMFYLTYTLYPKPPPDLQYFFVFKMFVNEMEVVTWDCTARNNWQGKTMFSLFDTGYEDAVEGTVSRDQNGEVVFNSIGPGLNKRIFKFGERDIRIVGDLTADGDKRNVEVRVYRADKKVRVPLPTHHDVLGRAAIFPHAGYLHPVAPKRYYHFGLIDPADKPYATFKFHYRSWQEINSLNIQLGQVDGDDASLFSSCGSADTHILDSPSKGATQPVHQSPMRSGRSSAATEYFDAMSDTRSIVGESIPPRAPTPLGPRSVRSAPTPEAYRPFGSLGPPALYSHYQPTHRSFVNPEASVFVPRTQHQPTYANSLRGNAPLFNYSGNAFLSPSKQGIVPNATARQTIPLHPDAGGFGSHQSIEKALPKVPINQSSPDRTLHANTQTFDESRIYDKRLSIPPSVLLQPLLDRRTNTLDRGTSSNAG